MRFSNLTSALRFFLGLLRRLFRFLSGFFGRFLFAFFTTTSAHFHSGNISLFVHEIQMALLPLNSGFYDHDGLSLTTGSTPGHLHFANVAFFVDKIEKAWLTANACLKNFHEFPS